MAQKPTAMANNTTIAVAQLRQMIFYHIDNDLLDTANFLAGRLLALDPKNPDSLHLLALTYLRLRRYKAAHDYAHKHGHISKHVGCAYVFAQACLHLGQHITGIRALELSKSLWQGKSNLGKHSETSRRHLPDAAACYTLLAKLWTSYGDLRKAGDLYIEAHKANPLLWDAFEGLCKLGADLHIPSMFKLPPEMATTSVATSEALSLVYEDDGANKAKPLAEQNVFSQQPFTPSVAQEPAVNPFINVPRPRVKGILGGMSDAIRGQFGGTPTANGAVDEDVAMGEGDDGNETDELPELIEAAPLRKQRPGPSLEQVDRPRQPQFRGSSQASVDSSQTGRPVGGQKRTISGQPAQASIGGGADSAAQPRRSHRLGQSSSRLLRSAADSTSSFASRLERTARAPPKAATGTKGKTQVGRVVSGNSNRKPVLSDQVEKDKEKRVPSRLGDKPGVTSAVVKQVAPATNQPTDAQIQAEKQAMTSLLDDFRTLALGYYATARFNLPEAIKTFKSLSPAQLQTPWALAQLGKAYYEAADYKNAEECFARVLKMQPGSIEGMEVYSTVLWHLKKEPALACLCYTLKDQDFRSPQTWCAVGNAFSLSRDHDQAIAAFGRATQIEPGFAYAWTLMGHEYIANEEFEAALNSFRKAVSIDRRGYGGWYGMGKSYERMGKLQDAEQHYRIASSINPSNSTLLVCVGVTYERMRMRSSALNSYTRALEVAPSSTLARFKKARVLMHLKQYEDAEEDLEILREQAPDEANVWFLLGKCYKGVGKKSDALRAFTTALNLDVKAAPFIKEAMEALDDDDDSE